MDVEDVKKYKTDMEYSIFNNLKRFEEQTGVYITSLNVERIELNGTGSKIIDVIIDINL